MTNEKEIRKDCEEFVIKMLNKYNILMFMTSHNKEGFIYTHNHARPELIPNLLVHILNQMMNSTTYENKIIPSNRYKDLMNSELKLLCLESAGVDNWDWYGDAMKEYNRITEEELKNDK